MNKVVLTGRMSKDPEVRYTETGKTVAQFTIAVDRPFTNEEGKKECDFIPCVIWGKPAEFIGNNFSKGKWIEVEGRLQVRSYEGKDGGKRYVTEVVVGSAGFVGPKDSVSIKPAEKPAEKAAAFDDDIPF